MDFMVHLDVTTRASGADAVICDNRGCILLCASEPLGCEHQGKFIGSSYVRQVQTSGSLRDTGMIKGLYDESRYICSVPISTGNSNMLGIVMLSKTTVKNQTILEQMTDLFSYLSLVVILATSLIIFLIVRRQRGPLKDLAQTARAFGHGNLNARVRLHHHYSHEVEELALSFNNMASSLQKSEYQRQEFVANVSHELKTPMTTISGYVDGILDGTIPEEKQEHYMRIVSDENKRLSRLVRSMLDISQLNTEQGIPEEKKLRFDVEECAGQVLITFEQKITNKEVQVEVDMPDHPVYIFANQDYITQVIYNLLDNAVKFCPVGGTVGLRIREGMDKAYISIYNDGQTIPAKELPLVFDRFHKIDKSRSENRDGWGLGLYIVKTIVCSHGENISVSSLEGRTEFTFTMPLII